MNPTEPLRRSKRFLWLLHATPIQLEALAKRYRKRALKEQPGAEKQRLFTQANRMRALAKMRAKRKLTDPSR